MTKQFVVQYAEMKGEHFDKEKLTNMAEGVFRAFYQLFSDKERIGLGDRFEIHLGTLDTISTKYKVATNARSPEHIIKSISRDLIKAQELSFLAENPVLARAYFNYLGKRELDDKRKKILDDLMMGIYMLPLPLIEPKTIDEVCE